MGTNTLFFFAFGVTSLVICEVISYQAFGVFFLFFFYFSSFIHSNSISFHRFFLFFFFCSLRFLRLFTPNWKQRFLTVFSTQGNYEIILNSQFTFNKHSKQLKWAHTKNETSWKKPKNFLLIRKWHNHQREKNGKRKKKTKNKKPFIRNMKSCRRLFNDILLWINHHYNKWREFSCSIFVFEEKVSQWWHLITYVWIIWKLLIIIKLIVVRWINMN